MQAHDAPLLIAGPLTILAILSIFIGYFFKDMAIGVGSDFWNGALTILFTNNATVEAEFLPFTIKIFPVVISLLGCAMAVIIYDYCTKYLMQITNNSFFRELYIFLNKKWYFDKLYAETIYQNVLYLSYNPLYTVFDKGIFNILGPRVLTNTLEKLSMHVSEMQTGFFYHYALIFLISLTILIMISSINFFILLIILFILFFFIFKKENK